MLQVNNLTKAYGRQIIFDNVSFTVNAGERVGLVGRNGHGKTTLLRMIRGDEQPDEGSITVPSGYRIGYLSQHLRFSRETVLGETCLGLRHTPDGKDETYRAETILNGLGISSDDFVRSPRDLSGGFQVRLNLAQVLVSEPNLLLLDEPTNYLDIVSMRWLGRFLRCWRGELILITHDRGFMDSVTTHTMAIHRCGMRKLAGQTEKVYQQLLEEEEIHERTRINEEKKRREVEQFINRFRAKATKARAVQSRIRALEKRERLDKIAEIKDLEFEFSSAAFTGKIVMESENIFFSFDSGEPPIIGGLSLTVGKKDRIAVIGKNGKGKTTLLKLLAGELSPRRGRISGHPDLKLAYFGQTNVDRLDPQKTVEEEIISVHPEYNRRAARNICGAMMFEGDDALKKICVLSGGEKSRVLLGKLLVKPANMLLLDEPTNHLDMQSTESLMYALEAFPGAVVIVAHSEMILHSMAERLVVFDGGEVTVFEGTYQDFLDRVGWKDEEADVSASAKSTGDQKKCPTKKDLRRLRAEIIAQRSQTLGPMEQRISDLESLIMRLESEMEKDNELLVDASIKGDGVLIKNLSISARTARETIESLFDELALLSGEFEVKSKEFEERLSEVNQA
jgi:ATP-binding cassette subfamily F protein 3